MHPAEFTIGIEEEYQLVETETGALRGRAPELLAEDGPIKQEYQRTMIEVNTPICASAEEGRRRLIERRSFVARLGREKGLAIAAAGLHPVGSYPAAQVTDIAEYHRIAARGGIFSRELHIFGMHVHVAVPNREAAVRAMCGAAPFVPHLLALCGSSPFYHGEDTAFQSFRTILRDMSPRVAPPFPMTSAAEYDRLERILAGRSLDPARNSPIAWDIRPSNRYPTLEFRFFDASPWLDTAVLLAAMARALTVMFADRPPPQPSGIELQLMRENRWRAARFGIAARFFRLDPVTGEERSARNAILGLAERLTPIAERLGDGQVLAAIERALDRGSAAAAMREVYRRTASLPDVTRWTVEQTAAF